MHAALVVLVTAASLASGRCGQTAADTGTVTGSLTSKVGGYAVFECPARLERVARRDRFAVTQWTKNGRSVFTLSDGSLTVDERYEGRATVVEPPEFGGALATSINVSSLRESDTGDYECRVTYKRRDPPPSSASSPRPSLPQPSPPSPQQQPPPPPSSRQPSTDSTLSTTAAGTDVAGAVVRIKLDVQGGDIMTIPPVNQIRLEHESVHFSCVKEDLRSAVQWYKDGVPLDDLPVFSGRFRVSLEGSLDIYDAGLNDNGFYSCRIMSAKGTYSAGAFLNVQYKAKIVYSPAEVFLAFGKPGTLDCHFHSNPPLTKIRWEKDGFLFDTYNVPGVYHKLNGSLYFNRVGKEHGGKYTCTPFNDLGTEGPSTPMDVIVQHPPKLIVVPKVLYFRKLGDNITMPCEADNADNRSPAIVWQKADGKSLFDPRVTVAGGNLTLTGVRSEDRGVYRCVASNIAATISAETELIVEESLFQRKNFGLHINSTNKNIVAYWKRPYSFCTVWSRDTSLEWSNWNATATSSDGKAILWNLNANKEYEIMVSCREEISGESMFSKSILTRPKAVIAESARPNLQELRKYNGPAADSLDIRVERSGDMYNVSWTLADNPTEHRARVDRYEVKWYDAFDGTELGTASTEANERYIVAGLAGGKTYGIRVTGTTVDGRQIPSITGSRSFQTPAAAVAATTSSTSPPFVTAAKYYYMALFGLFVAGSVVLCCNCYSKSR